MANLRYILQNEIFDNLEEKLIVYTHVNKALKKKKASFLCISITQDQPYTVYIHQIKKIEKNTYKKKRTWPLTNLKCIDCKNKNKNHLEFDMIFDDDKIYKWSSVNTEERRIFILYLWKEIMNQPIKEKPEFKNMPLDWIKDGVTTNEKEEIIQDLNDTNEDYQILTEKEESDLESLMSTCDFAISNIESFVEILIRDLNLLDGENIQTVLTSEEQVTQLMKQISTSLNEVEKVETQLNYYDDILFYIKNTMINMEHKNTLIDVINKNNVKLLSTLEYLISNLDFPSEYENSLIDTDLTSEKGLKLAIKSSKLLENVININIHPGLNKLYSVQEQKKRYDKWRMKFSYSISRHLNNLFVHLGNDSTMNKQLDCSSVSPTSLSLPSHNHIHKELNVYTELMHWCKHMDRKAYNELIKVYISTVGKLYERNIQYFLEDAKICISGTTPHSIEDNNNKKLNITKNLSSTQSQLLGTSGNIIGNGGNFLLGNEIQNNKINNEINKKQRQRFDEIFNIILEQLEPLCLNEQHFCIQFFQLNIQTQQNIIQNQQQQLNISNTNQNLNISQNISQNLNISEQNISQDGSLNTNTNVNTSIIDNDNKKLEKQMDEEVRKIMSDIFNCIENDLLNFISYHEKLDNIYCMYILVRLTQHVMSSQNTNSFLCKIYGSILVQVKRSYDKYMQIQLNSIQECKINKKNKCGILPFVYNFEEFAKNCQFIFNNTERKTDLYKWYVRIIQVIFDNVNNIAHEHGKTPPSVIRMENFHHIYCVLSQLKINVLDNYRKDAKNKYNEALKLYVIQYFGRPLEKLNIFFDGIQVKVNQGIKESEISYQMMYSKQELRKVIKEYPNKEVKKGLENLYKKVEKHLSEEENLLQVVWRAMQEEFILQYKSIEHLIGKCYPGSMITLDFTMDDILMFFSEIACSH